MEPSTGFRENVRKKVTTLRKSVKIQENRIKFVCLRETLGQNGKKLEINLHIS